MSATHEVTAETKTVTRTASGRITWASKKVRNEAILAQLERDGYTVKINTELLGRKYYIARSASVVSGSGQLERAFTSVAQLNKYISEWNRYSHLHSSIEVVHRDAVINRASNYILGEQHPSFRV